MQFYPRMTLVFRGLGVFCLMALGTAPFSSAAWAKPEGIASPDCRGCHEGTKDATVKLVPSTTMPAFDQTVRLSVSIESPIAKRGGLYLEAMSIAATPALVGQYKLVAGQGTKLIEMGVTHDGVPKTAVNGKVTFDIDWVAPKTKTSVVFTVNAIGGNMADRDLGDSFGRARVAMAVGCAGGTDYWVDLDEDGFGDDATMSIKACDPAKGIANKKGDCNDNDKLTSPSAKELCNAVDDNCDGKTDEGFPPVALYRDLDGDGFGAGTESMMGCGKVFGWGVGNKDCDDNSKMINPDAMEMCNNKDDDCDGKTDDGALPVCGMGLCVRTAPSCDTLSSCRPGTPKPEKCNFLDDDCDGVTDNGDAICPSGQGCVDGTCKAGGGGAGGNKGGAGGDSGGAGGDSGGAGGSDNSDKSSGGGCQLASRGVPSSSVWLILGLVSFFGLRRRSRGRSA
jgi:uncharacterized membrane protein YgcG